MKSFKLLVIASLPLSFFSLISTMQSHRLHTKEHSVIVINHEILLQRKESKLFVVWNTPVSLKAKMLFLYISLKKFNTYTEELLDYIDSTYLVDPKLCYELKKLVIALDCHSLEINLSMLALIKDLKNDGHILHLLFNNGIKTFQILNNQTSITALFNLFDTHNIQFIDFSSHPIITTNNADYFHHYGAKIQTKGIIKNNDQLLYIDNNYNHLVAAKKCDIKTVFFKDPYQLRTDLRNMNLI